MAEDDAINLAGLVVMLYTATGMAGTFLLCMLATRVPRHRLIVILCLMGAMFQLLLLASSGISSFIGIRMLQTAAIAAVIPLVFSVFSSASDGWVVGFLNSSRFAGNAFGPIIATNVLAFGGLNWLYTCLGSMGLLALAFYSGLCCGRTK